MQKTSDGRINPSVSEFADGSDRQGNILNFSNVCGDSSVMMGTQNPWRYCARRVRVIVLTRSESESKENAGCGLEDKWLPSRSLL